jgi:defect-in-organelle-trafficking protein DotB
MIGGLILEEQARGKSEAEHSFVATSRQTPGVEGARQVEADPSSSTVYLSERESSRITIREFRAFVMSAVASGASDITLQSDQQPRVEIHGRLYKATRRPWSPSEITEVLSELYGASNATVEINGKNVLDFSYELNLDDGSKQRFRVNATGILALDSAGVEITMRALPTKTPMIGDVGLSADLVRAMSPRDGFVVVAGGTGHGKSTSLAAVIGNHLLNEASPVKIVDIQAPIEFTYRDLMDRLEGSPSEIGQSEVGRHIRSFAEGVRSALRRKPHIISVGEARDYETISASLEASLTGHLVYTTTHAGSVVDAMRRLLSTFPAEEKDARAYDLVSTLRFLAVQQLVTRRDRAGRIPVREYLEFSPEVRQALFSEPVSRWPHTVSGIMREAGVTTFQRRTFYDEVVPLLDRGILTSDDALRISGDHRFLKAVRS